MKSDHSKHIEILESRIAPARTIIAGIPNSLPNSDTDFADTNPNEQFFVNTEANAADPISGAVGGGFPNVADTFYIRLSAGDRLQLFRTGGGSSVEDFLIVQSGNIVAFFIDKPDANGNRDNEVQESEIVGIAMGNNAQFELKAALSGDIIANLDEQGTPSTADDRLIMGGPLDTFQKANVKIKGFTVGSSVGGTVDLGAGVIEEVGGKVLASGAINNVIISGNVGSIQAGSAGSGETFDFFPKYNANAGVVDTPGGNGTFFFTPAPGKAGSPINRVILDSITHEIQGGIGGEGAKGGKITYVTVREDADGFAIRGGDGGSSGATRPSGGSGGSVSRIFVAGPDDFTANDLIEISGGDGGASTASTGGKGGTVGTVFVGFDIISGQPILSNGILRDDILVQGGAGGAGKTGGKGGSVSALTLLSSTPESGGDEIEVRGGDGGNSILPAGGKAGAGGSVSKSKINNTETSIDHDIGVYGGSAGSSSGLGAGAVGGGVTSLSLLGRQLTIEGGDGSDGRTGGKGGDVSAIQILQGEGIIADAIVLNGGIGGDGNAGTAGKGGSVFGINVINSDLTVLEINNGVHGNGGSSLTGKGAAGGFVRGIAIVDSDQNASGGTANTITIRTGDGGAGAKGGGNAGLLSNTSILGYNIEPTFISGDGGAATIKGKGGAAGGVTQIEISVIGTVFRPIAGVPTNVDAAAAVRSGIGGDGAGIGGAGGAGGNISTVSINVPGAGSIRAGSGGAAPGANAAAGKGGSINFAGVFAGSGTGELIAGDAGATGAKPGAGGSILGRSTDELSGLFAELDLTIRAGNGTAGGAGGSIKLLGYGSTASALVPTPNGSILIRAGDGSASADGKFVGAGGSIQFVGGSVNSENGDTIIRAGDGGGALKKSAKGGSISNLTLQRGGGLDVEFSIQAGDAGDAPQGATGAQGGSVTGITVADILPEAIFRNIIAGDGGDALKNGGKGGSVITVNVIGHDIGVRGGEIYGVNTMGGIFTGAGGSGTKPGTNGDVRVVNADAIATIVAGKAPAPKLANYVDSIYVNNGQNLLKDSTGAFVSLPGSQQVFTFGGVTTNPPLAMNATAAEVELALDGIVPGGVTVSAALGGGYNITFNTLDDKAQIIGQEVVTITATDTIVGLGNFPLIVTETTNGGGNEVHSFRPIAPFKFSITLNEGPNTGETTVQIPATATDTELQAALEALIGISPGDVTVAKRTGATAPEGQFDVTFNNLAAHVPLQVVMFADPLTVTEAVTGSSENIGRETQNIQVDPLGQGQITFAFQSDSFGFTSPALVNVTSLSNALNLQPSIIAKGGVTVTGLANNTYQIQFGAAGDQPAISVEEDAYPLGYAAIITDGAPGISEVVRVTPIITGANLIMQFGYDGNASARLTNPNALAIENAIESLPGLSASVTSVVADIDSSYRITFAPGARNLLNVAQAAAPATPLTGVSVTTRPTNLALSEIQRFQTDDTGFFAVTAQTANGLFTTGFLTAGATALEVQNALDAIIPGVTVVSPATNIYEVTYVDPNVNQPPLRISGLNIDQTVSEAVKGVNTPNRQEVQVIEYNPEGEFAVHFPVAFAAEEFTQGTAQVSELQRLDLEAIQFTPGGQFFLSYQGVSTTTPLAINATAGQIQTALNSLSSIAATGPGGVGGTVAVADIGGGRFDITFSNRGNQSGVISGTVDGGVSTILLSGTATAIEIETAIDNIPSVAAIGGVTVVQLQQGEAFVIFNEFGEKPLMAAYGQVREVQDINFYNVGDFTIQYGANPADVTGVIAAGASPTAVQNALNAIPAVQLLGGVTASDGINSNYQIQFNNAGDFETFSGLQLVSLLNTTTTEGTPGTAEVQQIKQPRRFIFDQNKYDTGNLVGAVSDPSEIEARTFRWNDVNDNDVFDSGEIPVDGLLAAFKFNQANANFTPEARIVGGEFSVIEQIKGTIADPEVQVLSVKSAKYSLAFNGAVTTPLPGKATALAIQNALNALATIQATGIANSGAVTVTPGIQPNTFNVIFNNPGDQPAIFAPFFYDYNNLL